MKFPNVEKAIEEVLVAAGHRAVLHLPESPNYDTPLNQIELQPGSPGAAPYLREETVEITTHANGRTAGREEADAIRILLESGPHGTSFGLLDRVVCEVTPAPLPSDSGKTDYLSAIYIVDTRPIY